MKFSLQGIVAALLFMIGAYGYFRLFTENKRVEAEVMRLESELGKMNIQSPDRVYLVAIESPEIPPEVAKHVSALWQFRCYFPPGYDFMHMCGEGNVTEDGLYMDGGYGSGWRGASKEPINQLITFSLQKDKDRWIAYYNIGGSSGSNSWNRWNGEASDALIVQEIVSGKSGAKSFDHETIIPMLKVYQSDSATERTIGGTPSTTFIGGLFVICPKSREAELNQLRRGETPVGFRPDTVATLEKGSE